MGLTSGAMSWVLIPFRGHYLPFLVFGKKETETGEVYPSADYILKLRKVVAEAEKMADDEQE